MGRYLLGRDGGLDDDLVVAYRIDDIAQSAFAFGQLLERRLAFGIHEHAGGHCGDEPARR